MEKLKPPPLTPGTYGLIFNLVQIPVIIAVVWFAFSFSTTAGVVAAVVVTVFFLLLNNYLCNRFKAQQIAYEKQQDELYDRLLIKLDYLLDNKDQCQK